VLTPTPVPILLVDDRLENLIALEALFDRSEDVELVKASSGEEALRLLLKRDFALVLMDVQMPGMDGFETAALMRANPKTRHVPIVFVTALLTGQSYQFKGYEAGAVDYLTKPIEPMILRAKVAVFVTLFRQRREIEEHERYMEHIEKLVAERAHSLKATDDKVRILLVDDRPENLLALEGTLADLGGVEMVKAESGGDALREVLHNHFAVVLMDVQMPGMDGFQTAELIRTNPHSSQLPIIFVTAGMKDHSYQFKGYEQGAVDYLIKPLDPVILRSKVKVFCDLFRQRLRLEKQSTYLEELVTERTAELKQTAFELEVSRERYQRLLESVTNHVYSVTLEGGRLISTGHRFDCEAVTGYAVNAYDADPSLWYTMVVESDRDAFQDAIRHVIADGKTRRLEHRIVHQSGALRWMRTTFVLRSRRSRTTSTLGKAEEEAICDVLIEDIDERKQAEATVARLAERLDLATRAARLGIWDWSIPDNSLLWDDCMFELYGIRREDFAGAYEAWLSALHPDDREHCNEAIQHALRHEAPYDVEFRVRWPDGSVHYIKANGQVVWDAEGQPLRMTGVNYDISERKRNEQEILHHRDHLLELVDEQTSNIKAIVDNAADGIVTTDSRLAILSFNAAAERMFGYRADEVLGREVGLLMPEPFRTDVIGVGREVSGQRKNGSVFPLYSAVSEMEAGGEKRFIAILRDISGQKEAEAKLIRAREEAEAANEAKSAFIANMSHEIRTPMNAIIGMTDLVLESSLQPEQQKLLKSVADSAKSLLAILNDVLDLSKLDSGKMELESVPFSLRQLLEEVESVFQANAAAKGVTLLFQLDDGAPPCVNGDPTRLRQVLLNLVGNALKFTPEGRIDVTARRGEAADEWLFNVRDTGIGIPRARLDTIFERFSQADQSTTRRFGGTGLGTTISRGIVERMGGRIWVDSVEGQGSTFSFSVRLPEAVGVTECRTSLMPRQREVPRTRPLMILLAEDIPLNQELVVRRLAQNGHQVKVAENGQVAVELFRRQHFDLVLMDAMMPELDGIAATRAIRAQEAASGSHVPIVMLTASVMQSDRSQYRAAGADDYVGKPIDFTELFTKIARYFPVVDQEVEPVRLLDDQRAALPVLPGLDLAAGMAEWGELAQYRKALATFRQDYALAPDSLAAMLAAGQGDEALRLAHTLKGLAGNLGAPALVRALISLEHALKDGVTPSEEQVNMLRDRFVEVMGSIAHFEQLPSPAAPPAKAPADPARLAASLQRLHRALQCAELDEQAIADLRGELDHERFSRLEMLIDCFDFARARAYVDDLLRPLQAQG
jgi:PAS domain S-box-containing protein